MYAQGLSEMRKALEADGGFEVVVIAPDRERSACGHAITMHKPLMVQEVRLPGNSKPAWLVGGTPADCAKLAVEALLPKAPDLIISGINRGPNLGTDVFYSGTVSAAIEGAIMNVPSMAVSLATREKPDYCFAAAFATYLAKKVVENGLPRATLLNVNVPPVMRSEIAGVAVVRLGIRRYLNVFDRRIDPRGRVYYWMAGEVEGAGSERGTDDWAIANNMVSVTPIQLDLTAHGAIHEIEGWGLEVGRRLT